MAGQSYHHGDLKRALVEAGLRLLEKGGPESVSLRATARELGVSRSAPYAHFPSKRVLMSLIAAQGYARLTAVIERVACGEPDPAHAMGVEYVQFALANPGLYRLMFNSSATVDFDEPELARASSEAFASLEKRSSREGDPGVARISAISAWSTVHGLSMLLIDQRLSAEWRGRVSELIRTHNRRHK